jgi:hypothetical protein
MPKRIRSPPELAVALLIFLVMTGLHQITRKVPPGHFGVILGNGDCALRTGAVAFN